MCRLKFLVCFFEPWPISHVRLLYASPGQELARSQLIISVFIDCRVIFLELS